MTGPDLIWKMPLVLCRHLTAWRARFRRWLWALGWNLSSYSFPTLDGDSPSAFWVPAWEGAALTPRGPEQTLRTRHTATCIQRGARAKAPPLSSHANKALGCGLGCDT